MTYGEWVNEELGWHQTEHILSSLNCGREYHVYVVLFNALGASPASQVYLAILCTFDLSRESEKNYEFFARKPILRLKIMEFWQLS